MIVHVTSQGSVADTEDIFYGCCMNFTPDQQLEFDINLAIMNFELRRSNGGDKGTTSSEEPHHGA
jgi:hypothetical protein